MYYVCIMYVLFPYPITELIVKHLKNRQDLLTQKNKWGFTTLGNKIFQLIRQSLGKNIMVIRFWS